MLIKIDIDLKIAIPYNYIVKIICNYKMEMKLVKVLLTSYDFLTLISLNKKC